MYKPNTALILTDLWAAAAADKLRFEWAQWNHIYQEWESSEVATLGVCVRRGDDIFKADENSDYPPIFEEAKKWRITVTESGPNGAGRFLPQAGDLIEFCEKTLKVLPAKERALFVHNQIELKDAVDFVDRIIERNNTPFPQFSEVIEP